MLESKISLPVKFVFPFAFSLAMLLVPKAQAIDSVNVQTYNPSTSDHFVFLEDGYQSEWPKVSKYYFGANYNYVSEPLVVLDATQSMKTAAIIDSIQTIDLMFGFKAANNLGLFIGLPVNFINFSADSPAGFNKNSVTGLGDTKLVAKIRVTDDASATSVAIIPEIHLPTGATQYFVSDASTYVGLRATIERQFDAFTLVGNLGFAAAANAIYEDSTFSGGIDYRKRLTVGIGGFLPFNDHWGADFEFVNTSSIPFDKALNPNDAYAGLRYAASDGLSFTGGGSIGRIGGPGGSDYRIVAGVRCTTFEPKRDLPKPITFAPLPSETPWPSPTPWPTPIPRSGATSAGNVSTSHQASTQTPTRFNSALLLNGAPTPGKIVKAEANRSTPEVVTNPPSAELQPRAWLTQNAIELSSPIQFLKNSALINTDSKKTLDEVARLINRNQKTIQKIFIVGYAGASNPKRTNSTSVSTRVLSVKRYLLQHGVSAKLIQVRKVSSRDSLDSHYPIEFTIAH